MLHKIEEMIAEMEEMEREGVKRVLISVAAEDHTGTPKNFIRLPWPDAPYGAVISDDELAIAVRERRILNEHYTYGARLYTCEFDLSQFKAWLIRERIRIATFNTLWIEGLDKE